jgi:4'-phosphopantetheinyl transferase
MVNWPPADPLLDHVARRETPMMPREPLQIDRVRARWRDGLDVEERARADRFRFARDRDVFIAAHALARAMLSGATGLPADAWQFVTGLYGKPALAADCAASGLRFNLSHTRGLAACAIAYSEVGIDVEAADRRVDFAIADRFFAPAEALAVSQSAVEDKAALFFRTWTLKEAFIKATGEGLRRPLASFSFAFDPIRLSFHPERDDAPRPDDAAAWQFFECCPMPERPLALAVKRPGPRWAQLDERGARPDEI